MLKSFEWRLPSTILFGPGKLNEIGKVVQGFGKRCLIVTTRPEPWNRAIVDRVVASLASSGVESHWFSGVGANPTTDQISAGAAAAREFRADVVLGLGGGSAMDGAKAIAVEATHPGGAWDYLWFREKQPSSATLPVIAVSTTSGTGSQLTQVAVVTKTDERCKSAIYNDIILPRVAVVDPELMLSVPPRMTAFTGFDALTHAFESFLHPNCDAFVYMMAREAISIVLKWLPVAVGDGKEPGGPLSDGSRRFAGGDVHPARRRHPAARHGDGDRRHVSARRPWTGAGHRLSGLPRLHPCCRRPTVRLARPPDRSRHGVAR